MLSDSSRSANLTQSQWRARLGARVDHILRDEVKSYSVIVLDPLSGFRMSVRPDKKFHSASTMKVGIMLALYRLAEQKKLSLNDKIPVRNRFKSVVGRSYYRVPPEDSETCICTTYKHRWRKMTLKELNSDMIRSSSNLATNILIQHLGTNRIKRELGKMGIRDLSIIRGLYDMKAYNRGWNNTFTARSMLKSFQVLLSPQYFNEEMRRQMIQVLSTTEHRDKIPGHLPVDIQVAQKSGYTDDVSHDAGLVYPEPGKPPYVVIILTKGHKNKFDVEEKMAWASREIFDAILEMRKNKKQQ